MAKLNRIVARIFGSGAGVDQVSQFGSLAAGSPAFTTDAATAQSLSNWLTGWFGAVIGGNAPAIEDMNSFCFVIAYQIAYMMQSGVPEWNTDTIYYIGSMANVAGVIFVSLTDNNQGNAVTDLTNWQRFGSQQSVVTKTANYTLTGNDFLILGNAGSGAFQLTLPAASGLNGKVFNLKKIDSSANVITILAAGADTIDGASTLTMTVPYEATMLISDGVNSWSIF